MPPSPLPTLPPGEIIPQAACSRYGLLIGSYMAIPVRILMVLTSPISWPISKVLDYVLGGETSSLFRRKQLKARSMADDWFESSRCHVARLLDLAFPLTPQALVHIHAKDEGFGGKLSPDEIQIITGMCFKSKYWCRFAPCVLLTDCTCKCSSHMLSLFIFVACF